MHFSRLFFVICLLAASPVAEASGSWSTQVGGNLRQLTAADVRCDEFASAEYMRVGRPVGFGIVHEFFGVVMTANGRRHVFVTGLNNDTDLKAFSQSIERSIDAEELMIGPSHVIDSCSVFIATLGRINRRMAQSAYNDPLVYAAAMVARPLMGQPCSNMADAVAAVLD
jgi:hypothetical protein